MLKRSFGNARLLCLFLGVIPLASTWARQHNFLQNGGFEDQVTPSKTNPPGYIYTTTVPSWKTTASDGLIEIWASGYSSESNGPVYSVMRRGPFFDNGGKFFAELNATQVSTLYQDVTATKSGLISYSFWARGRRETDVMGLQIDELQGNVWVPIFKKLYSNPPGVWVNHQGNYLALVTAGTKLRFSYISIKGSTVSIGNFLDNAAFGILDPNKPTPPGEPGVLPPLAVIDIDGRDRIFEPLIRDGLAFHSAVSDQTFLQIRQTGGMLGQQFYNTRTRLEPLPEEAAPDPKRMIPPDGKNVVRADGKQMISSEDTKGTPKSAFELSGNLWTSTSGIYSNFGALDAVSSRHSLAGNFMVGVDFAVSAHVSLGVFANYQHLEQDFRDLGGGDVKTDGTNYGAYLSYARPEGGFYFDVAAGGAYYESSIRRPISVNGFTDGTARSDAHSTGLFAFLDGGYDIRRGNWSFGPTGSLQFGRLNDAARSEDDPYDVQLRIDHQKLNSVYSGLGAHLNYRYRINQSVALVPEIRCIWNHEFDDSRTVHGSTPLAPGTHYSYVDQGSGQDSVTPSAGVTALFGRNFTVGLFYSANLFSNNSIQSLTLTGSWAF